MKKIFLFSLVPFLTFGSIQQVEAQTRKAVRTNSKNAPINTAPQKKVANRTATPVASRTKQVLQNTLEIARSGQYQSAASQLFNLSRRSEYQNDRAQIKYILGLMLMEMKLNQVAAFQFVDVIRLKDPKYTKLAVEKLSVVADTMGDDTMLNYAVKHLDINSIPSQNRDMVWFRIGEVKLNNRDFAGAEAAFSKVQSGSSYSNQAVFNRGRSLMEQNKLDEAIAAFNTLLSMRSKAGVTDTNRVAAQLALARTYYQKNEWDDAIEAYSKIPRDHVLWHDALFEQSWALLRAARLRSVLSNFQSLHSAYYEDFYIPESLLLRSIVYLYICKYDEMEKVLQLFEKTYGPVANRMRDFVSTNKGAYSYWSEIERGIGLRNGKQLSNTKLPVMVINSLLDQGNIRRSLSYIRSLDEERNRIDTNASFKSSPLGRYGSKILANRKKNSQLAIGDMAKAHLTNMRTELRDLYEQAGFIRYEMINGKKEVLKKKLAGKDLGEELVDEKRDRSFYVQNGYEYYPFTGEFWLDEIGNYHYLGKSSCE